ncbi:MAG: hypothetical protein IT428_23960 [Planctomycetaceae bacterium]|nr:hypothetical protein [Planctomycetaceae bacterium]
MLSLRQALVVCVAGTSFVTAAACAEVSLAAGPTVRVDKPMLPPAWAVLERQLLKANDEACELFFKRYFDDRGWLLCVERWGGDDGPDDAIENLIYWPMLHALGGSNRILELYKKAWEGHLRQYTLAKTTEVPFARDGMYYREFPVMFDWLHNSEGLTVFCHQGLSDPYDAAFRTRMVRFAKFYTGEDPTAPNYDPKHRIIKSLFNGSRGPLLRKATALDWAGDPIEVEGRFSLGHGERTYQEMLDHFRDYTDIVGDHPGNMAATSLAFHAYCLTGDEKYRKWVLEYVDAWAERAKQNKDILPSNIGLDGTIGGAAGGKWYGGTYGWAFSPTVPQTGKVAHRNTTNLGIQGFLNAHLLTGDAKYLDVWRRQIDAINANGKMVDGKMQYPHMYGDDGWYAYSALKYDIGARDIWLSTLDPKDLERAGKTGWAEWLAGKNPKYAETALQNDFGKLRGMVELIRKDETTPDTRLADDSMQLNPCSIGSLLELTTGSLLPSKNGLVMRARLRYFDPTERRAGLPDDVAALIDGMTADSTTVTLVNVNPVEARTVVVQSGAYAEHEMTSVKMGDATFAVNGPQLTVRLAPGCGERLVISQKSYALRPKTALPW